MVYFETDEMTELVDLSEIVPIYETDATTDFAESIEIDAYVAFDETFEVVYVEFLEIVAFSAMSVFVVSSHSTLIHSDELSTTTPIRCLKPTMSCSAATAMSYRCWWCWYWSFRWKKNCALARRRGDGRPFLCSN